MPDEMKRVSTHFEVRSKKAYRHEDDRPIHKYDDEPSARLKAMSLALGYRGCRSDVPAITLHQVDTHERKLATFDADGVAEELSTVGDGL